MPSEYTKSSPPNIPAERVRVFTTPVPDDYRSPDWPDEELRRWVAYLKDERAASLDANNDRTAGTVAFCEHRMDAMLAELERRERLARQFRHDPRGPRWSTAGADRRAGLVELAQDLKRVWSIDRFLIQMMCVELTPAGRNRWKCRCFTGVHTDTDPSMAVYGDDGHVYCFACQYRGDILDITKLYFNVTSFSEAVRYLVAATGQEVAR
jgi:hypothetical protein